MYHMLSTTEWADSRIRYLESSKIYKSVKTSKLKSMKRRWPCSRTNSTKLLIKQKNSSMSCLMSNSSRSTSISTGTGWQSRSSSGRRSKAYRRGRVSWKQDLIRLSSTGRILGRKLRNWSTTSSRPSSKISNLRRRIDLSQFNISSSVCSKISQSCSSKSIRNRRNQVSDSIKSRRIWRRKRRSLTVPWTTRRRYERRAKSRWSNCLRKWWLKLRTRYKSRKKKGRQRKTLCLSYWRTHALN